MNMMMMKRFLLLAIGTSSVFFAALAGFLLLSTQEVEVSPRARGDINWSEFDLSKLTPEQLKAVGHRRVEAMARGSSSYVALREKYGDEGIAKIMMGISVVGDEDLSEASGERPVIVIEVDTLDEKEK